MKKSTIIVTAIFVVAIALAADVRVSEAKKSRTSNLNLEGIVNEIVDIMKRYELREVHGDRYSGQWVVEAFQKTGIHYWQTEQDKSVFYLGLEPLFAQGNIEILDHPELSR